MQPLRNVLVRPLLSLGVRVLEKRLSQVEPVHLFVDHSVSDQIFHDHRDVERDDETGSVIETHLKCSISVLRGKQQKY